MTDALKRRPGRPRAVRLGRESTVGVSFRLPDSEYREMVALGLPWKAILRAGYAALSKPNPLLERLRDLEQQQKAAEMKASRLSGKLTDVFLRLEKEFPKAHQTFLK